MTAADGICAETSSEDVRYSQIIAFRKSVHNILKAPSVMVLFLDPDIKKPPQCEGLFFMNDYFFSAGRLMKYSASPLPQFGSNAVLGL